MRAINAYKISSAQRVMCTKMHFVGQTTRIKQISWLKWNKSTKDIKNKNILHNKKRLHKRKKDV